MLPYYYPIDMAPRSISNMAHRSISYFNPYSFRHNRDDEGECNRCKSRRHEGEFRRHEGGCHRHEGEFRRHEGECRRHEGECRRHEGECRRHHCEECECRRHHCEECECRRHECECCHQEDLDLVMIKMK